MTNEELAQFAEGLWKNYIKPKFETELEHNVTFFRAQVEANEGDGMVTVKRPFDDTLLKIRAIDTMRWAVVGQQVLCLKFGNKNASNSVVFSDGSLHSVSGEYVSFDPTNGLVLANTNAFNNKVQIKSDGIHLSNDDVDGTVIEQNSVTVGMASENNNYFIKVNGSTGIEFHRNDAGTDVNLGSIYGFLGASGGIYMQGNNGADSGLYGGKVYLQATHNNGYVQFLNYPKSIKVYGVKGATTADDVLCDLLSLAHPINSVIATVANVKPFNDYTNGEFGVWTRAGTITSTGTGAGTIYLWKRTS